MKTKTYIISKDSLIQAIVGKGNVDAIVIHEGKVTQCVLVGHIQKLTVDEDGFMTVRTSNHQTVGLHIV